MEALMVRPSSAGGTSGTAENVATRMMLAGISTTELARTAGVSRDTITRWLEGKTSHPHRLNEILAALARLEDTRQMTDRSAPAAEVFEVAPGVEVALRPSDDASYGDVRRVSEVLARMARELRNKDWGGGGVVSVIRVDYVLADLTEHGIRAAVVNCNGDVTWVFDRQSLRDDPDATLDDASACVTAIANESFRVQLRPVNDIAS